jgi:fused signal recognition particle receptor
MDGWDLGAPELVGGGVALALIVALVAFVFGRRRAEERPDLLAPPPAVEAPAIRAGPPPPAEPAITRPGIAALLFDALGRSRDTLRAGLDRVLGRPLDPAAIETLEESLLRADVGVPTTARLLERLRGSSGGGEASAGGLESALRKEMVSILEGVDRRLAPPDGLWVVLVVGVNGSGKTTTIGKLAARLREQGRRVLLAAGDTYRAAAAEQLAIWAERAGAAIVRLDEGADPGAVAFRAVERARSEGYDVVIVDTAGRLQTRKPLMEQLSKIRRVLDKAEPGAPHETLLVLDATIGQNALSQAKLFHEATPITGAVITKLDGTAKGGMVLAIASELGVPVVLVGLGEKLGDLREFDPTGFVDGLIGTPPEHPSAL